MANLTDLTGQNITTTATATYAENISAGDNVKLNSSGQLAKWGVGELSSSLTTNEVKTSYTDPGSQYTYFCYAKNRSILFNMDGNDYLFAVERNNLTDTITRSEITKTEFANTRAIFFMEEANRLITLDSSATVYAWIYNQGVLTLDQSVSIVGASNIAGKGVPVLGRNASGEELLIIPCSYNDGSVHNRNIAIRFNGLTLEAAGNTIATVNKDYIHVKWDSANSKFVNVYYSPGDQAISVKSVTYSGLTPSFSAEVVSGSFGSNINYRFFAYDELRSKFIFVAPIQDDYVVIDASSATPTITPVATVSITTISTGWFAGNFSEAVLWDSNNQETFVVAIKDAGTDELASYSFALSAGDVLTVTETDLFSDFAVENSDINLYFDEAYQAIVLSFKAQADEHLFLGIGRIDASRNLVDFTPDQDNLIGVALDTKLATESGKYRLLDKYKGVLVKNLTGLIPGQEYYINSVGGLGTSITSDFYGLAISSTQAITSTVVGLLTEIKKLTIGEGRVIAQYTGSDNTASGTYTTICDQGGSGVLKSITCSSSNASAAVALRLTINGVETVLFGSLDANPLHGHNANESATWECDIPYQGGVKIEIDSSSVSYTTNCTVVLHQD